MLLAAQPESLNQRGSHGRTLLWEAVRAGKQDAVEFLVQAGADTDLTGCYNSESHVQLTPHCAAVYYGRDDLIDYLEARSRRPDIFRLAFLGRQNEVLRLIQRDAGC